MPAERGGVGRVLGPLRDEVAVAEIDGERGEPDEHHQEQRHPHEREPALVGFDPPPARLRLGRRVERLGIGDELVGHDEAQASVPTYGSSRMIVVPVNVRSPPNIRVTAVCFALM